MITGVIIFLLGGVVGYFIPNPYVIKIEKKNNVKAKIIDTSPDIDF